MSHGVFIVLEGPDGGGKTTQAALLAEALRAEGRDPLVLREPGHTRLGEEIRQILLGHRDEEIDPRAETCLFMAARAQLTAEVVRPALAAGRVVLSDRFLLSTVVYQGYADGKFDPVIEQMGRWVTQGIDPALTIILDVRPDAARARRQRAEDRMEAKGAAYHKRVREGYLAAARAHPERMAVIDTSDLDLRQTHEKVLAEARRALG
jgi:dTMP kinase